MRSRCPQFAARTGLLFLLALTAASCSSNAALHPVSGQITVNEKPAAGAQLFFHLEGSTINSIPSTATADAEGRFTVATGDKMGMPTGKYAVVVLWPEPKKLSPGEIMMGANPNDGPDRLKGAYDTPQKTTIRIEVKPGTNELAPITLKP